MSVKEQLHYKIRVSGRVQGVWFRKYTREAALSFGLKGFVENSSDGSVYLEAEGSREDLTQLLDWLRDGSPHSRVEEVSFAEGPFSGFTSFEIRR